MSELGVFYDMDDGEYAPMLELNADDAESAARTLRNHMTPDQIQALVRLLSQTDSKEALV